MIQFKANTIDDNKEVKAESIDWIDVIPYLKV